MTRCQPFAAVVFDLDGLMFNTEELYIEVGTRLLQRRGHTFTKELLDAMMGRPSATAYQVMIQWHNLTDGIDELEQEADVLFDDLLDTRLATMPGLLELLARLEAAGLPKAIATSSRRPFVRRVLGQFELEPRFAFVLTCEDVTHGKPHPEIYQKAAQRLGIEPPRMLVLEDSQAGCEAAAAAEAHVVAVPGDHSRRHDFRSARLVIDSLADPRLYALLGL